MGTRRCTASVLLLCGLALAGGPVWADHPGARPAEVDTAAQKLSAKGLYRVSYESRVAPVPINRIHSWILTVQTAAGQPVNDAKIEVGGSMPEHGHGLPTKPQVTENLGDGQYLLEGMKFQMPGYWVVDLSIHAPEGDDAVRFELLLGPGG